MKWFSWKQKIFSLLLSSIYSIIFISCSPQFNNNTIDDVLSTSSSSTSNSTISNANNLSWTQTSPTNSTTITANWTKSVSTDLANQYITFYRDASCTTLAAASINLNSTSTQTYNYTPGAQGDYYFTVTTYLSSGSNSESSCSSLVTIDTTAPMVTGLSNDATPTTAKNWSWGCSESPATYRYTIDQVSNTSPAGAYGSTTSASQSSGDGTYYIHVQCMDAAGNTSAKVHISALLDNTAPTAPSNVNDGSYLNSLTASNNNTWTASTDTNGIDHYEFAIGTTAGGTDVRTWTTTGGNSTNYTQAAGLSLTTNTTYYFSVRALDVAGNTSTVGQGNGWIADTTAPSNPGGITLSSATSPLSSSPVITWTASTDTSGSGVSYYQVSLFDVTVPSQVVNWTTKSSGTAFTGLSLTNGHSYNVGVKAYDNAGNVSTASYSSNFTAASGGIDHFAITMNYGEAISGHPFSMTVTAKDAANATLTTYTGTVQFISSDSGGSVSLPANYTYVGGDNGVKTFSATLSTVGSQTITAYDTTNSASAVTTITVINQTLTINDTNTGAGTARTSFAQVTLANGTTVLAFGGSDHSVVTAGGNPLSAVDKFDIPASSTTVTHTAMTSLNTTRVSASATLLSNGKILIVGGCQVVNCGTVLSSVELYDPAANAGTGSTTNMTSLNTARWGHKAYLMSGDKVLIIGGNTATVELYDPAANGGTGGSTNMTSLSTPRGWCSGITQLPDGRIFLAGGSNCTQTNTVEIYDPTANAGSGSTTAMNNMNTSRYYHRATALNNGKVLISGGYNSFASVELYDPAASAGSGSSTSLTNTITTGRYGQMQFLSQNGNGIIMIGGNNTAAVATSTTDFYDIANNIPIATSSLTAGTRSSFGCTLLGDGRYFYYGGSNGNATVTNTWGFITQ